MNAIFEISDSSGLPGFVSECCANCRFFASHMAEVNDAGEVTGECRRYPPVMPPGERRAVFPIVGAGDWCGEHRATITTKAM